MNIFSRLFRGETRTKTVKTSDPFLGEFFGQRGGLGGYVDTDRASGVATAQACIGTVTQALASVPLNLYRKGKNGARDKAREHPLYDVLHFMSNASTTAFEFREALIESVMINGNAYALKKWNGRGQVVELHLLHPSSVTVEKLESGRLRYKVTDARGRVHIHLQDDVLHIRYRLGRDGIMGISPIQHARETFTLALTQQEQAGKQAVKSFRPEGALVFPNTLGGDGKGAALAALRNKIESDSSTSGVLVLDGGADWKSFSFSSKDAEFLDSRKLTNLDICRIFNVPPTVAGITDNATYSNTDQESRALVVRCLAPMARRIEQAMNAALLPAMSRRSMFIEHDLAGLLRGDMKARYEAYRIGREWGWISPNEIRGWENMPDIEGGNEYLTPLNMAPIDERKPVEEE